MANEFITLKNIARMALPRLEANLVMPKLTYNDYSETYSDLGDTIQIKKPVVLEALDFKPGDTVTEQDVKESSVDVKLDKIATVDIGIGVLEAVHNWSEEKVIRDFIEPATSAIANKINKAGLEMYKEIPNILGVAGTTPSAMSDFANARKFFNIQKAPMADRYAVWSPEADAKFTEIANLFKVNEAGTSSALREGEIGRLLGIDNYMAQDVVAHVNGGAGTLTVDGGASKGATEIKLAGVSSALIPGDTFTIGGYTYTAVEVGEVATSKQTIKVCPEVQADITSGASATMVASAVNNLIFHKNAIAFVTRPLHAPAGENAYTTSNGQYSLRLVRGYDMATKREKLSMDVLYNYKVVYPELAARYLG